ncbi:MAG: hypothetical protein V4620_08775 [Bacteroidota bacterium]
MDTATCINNTIWEAYANKSISKTDMIYMEKHVKTCEVCADIKDGIDAMDNPSQLMQKVNTINHEIDVLVSTRKQVSKNNWYWPIAASLMISFGLLIYNYIQLPDGKVALNEVSKEEAQKPILTEEKNVALQSDTVIKNEIASDILAENNSKPKEEIITLKRNISEPAPAVVEQQLAFADDVATTGKNNDEANKEIVLVPEQISSNATATKAEEKLKAETDFTVVAKSFKDKTASTPASLSNNNYAAFFNNNNLNLTLNDSVSFFQVYKLDSANFSKAQIAYNKNKFDSCYIWLSNIVDNPNGYLYEDVLYLKANNFIKQNKINEAKQVLKQLIKHKGKKQKEATALLKTITR